MGELVLVELSDREALNAFRRAADARVLARRDIEGRSALASLLVSLIDPSDSLHDAFE